MLNRTFVLSDVRVCNLSAFIQQGKNIGLKLMLMILLLTGSISLSGQPKDTLKYHYKVGIRNNFEPIDFLNKYDKPVGITAEVLAEIAKSENVTFDLIPMSFNQTLKALNNDEVDFIPLIISLERRSEYCYSIPYCQITQALFQSTHNKNPVTINTLKGHTIGFIESDALLDTFATRTDFKKHIVLSKLDGFLHLRNGQIDAFFCGEQNGIKLIEENNITDIKLVTGHLYPREYAFATGKDHRQIIQMLDSQLSKLRASGKLKQLSDKWLTVELSKPNWLKTHGTLLITILSIFTLAIILLLFWNWLLRSMVAEKTKSIKESETKYRELVDYSPDAIAIYVDGIIVFVNEECLRLMHAVNVDELLGKNVIEFINPDYRAFIVERMKKAAAQDIVLPLAEEKFIRIDNSIVDVEVKAMQIKYENKSAVQLIVRDITERKKAEESLQNERLLLRAVIDNIPDLIYTKDLACKKTLANLAEVEFLGAASESEVLGKDDFEFYPKEIAEQFKLNDQLLLQTGTPDLNAESYILDSKGNKLCIISTRIPLRDKNNQIIGLLGIGRNITSRKIMEESLRLSEEHYRTLVELMPDGVYKSTHDGKFVSVNDALVKMLGYDSKEELLSIDITTQLYFDKSDRDSLISVDKMHEMSIYRLKKKDGSEIWVEDHGWYILNDIGDILFHEGVMRDVTGRLQSEQDLKKSREELKNFAAHLQTVREEERLQLANEIHDEVGQILIAVKIDMGILKQKTLKVIEPKNSDEILPKFENLLNLIDNTINTTRKIMTDNRQEVLHLLGFVESAKLQVSNFQEKYQINCQFKSEIKNLEINTQQSIALFRILQEALSNIAKYAQATVVKVKLFEKDNKLVLEIIDNGIGFTEKMETKRDAYGFIGMKERAFLLDGELYISSQLGKGTSIKVEIPYITYN